MSDDTPERMFVDWRPGLGVTNGPLTETYQGWVRADIHDAVLARVKALEARVLDLRFCVTQAHLTLTGHSPTRTPVEDAIKKLEDADVRYR